ncbi:flagellar hook-associated protein 3 FlgL [Sulfitobacter marinus]|uniref:Flagellar hook-associated protein 3 FlgL n=1 Tax=Sulfitobacter marinus TaxID=394264 RepID=A0A1I6V5J2_9RHOB|nr:flagellin [Sulfitobacter marinus]SFT08917.1 flagellar hook-associated protein 3 FlgL [Sulfitobacter marinus]
MTEISRTVSTALQSLRQRETTSRLAAQISDTSYEVTTGLKAKPYDALGHKSADAIAIRMQITRNDGFLASNALLDRRFLAVETSLGAIRDAGQDVLEQSFLAQSSAGQTSAQLSQAARAAIDTLIERSGVSDSSGYLMSGTSSDTKPLQGWDMPHPNTGLSPSEIVDDVVNGGLNTPADVQVAIDALSDIFSDQNAGDPARNFETSFYNGTPALDGGGLLNPPLTARISETETIAQTAQANNPAIRDLMRGLAMLSAVDVNQITDPVAREAWASEARNAITSGLSGLTELETNTGLKRTRLADTVAAQESRAGFLNGERLLLEGADQYDAATRLTQLQTQLESSYAVTARLSNLSFLNFM